MTVTHSDSHTSLSGKAFAGAILLGFLTLSVGCTTAKFAAYEGDQQDWPTAPGALVETIHGVPVYHGFPPRPYKVLGQLTLEQGHKFAPAALDKAASEAKTYGADAVIVLSEGQNLLGFSGSSQGTAQTWGTGATTYSGTSYGRAVYGSTAKVLLIKFI